MITEDELNGANFKITLSLPVNSFESENGDLVGVCEDGNPMWNHEMNAIKIIVYDQLGQYVNTIQFNQGIDILPAYQNEKGEVTLYLEELLDEDGISVSLYGRKKGSGVYLYDGIVKSNSVPSDCNTVDKRPSRKTEDFFVNVGYIR